jgi:hypothetical protein
VIILLINFCHNFLLEADLACYASLHASALSLLILADFEDFVKLRYSLLRGHLKGLYLVALVCEGAIQAKDHISDRAESLKLLVLTLRDPSYYRGVCCFHLSKKF